MARDSGEAKCSWFSAAPGFASRMFTASICQAVTELIAHGRDNETICKQIGADAFDLPNTRFNLCCKSMGNQDISFWYFSIQRSEYVTGDIDQAYLDFLDSLRNDDSKVEREIQQDLANLELHNEGA